MQEWYNLVSLSVCTFVLRGLGGSVTVGLRPVTCITHSIYAKFVLGQGMKKVDKAMTA